jgi:hypothetical protein
MSLVATVHLVQLSPAASIRALRSVPSPGRIGGLRWAEVGAGAHFGRGVLPPPAPGRVALLALWEDDAAIDRFFAGEHPVAETFRPGWSVRLEPLRQTGRIAGMPRLVDDEQPVDDTEPVAVLTYGHTKYRTLKPFLQANQGATVDALDSPALLAATGLARPPRMVGTFSLWRTAAEMKDYAYRRGGGHSGAMLDHAHIGFHHEALFARFRPYASAGAWDGRDPLASVAPAGAVGERAA